MDESLAAEIARESADWLLFAFVVLAPIATLFALWRVRAGVAQAGFPGMLARIAAGPAAIFVIAYAVLAAMEPGVEQHTADCWASPNAYECDETGVFYAAFLLMPALALMAFWPVAILLMRGAIAVWRWSGRRSTA
jgi:hypothetical protein